MIKFARANKLAFVLIPPGTTPFLQVGDTHLHAIFKRSLAQQWDDYKLDLIEAGQSLNDLNIDIMRKWIARAVVKAADEINQPALIKKAFLDNGLSNSLDGSQESSVHTSKMLFV